MEKAETTARGMVTSSASFALIDVASFRQARILQLRAVSSIDRTSRRYS